jgi:hypothetical protein
MLTLHFAMLHLSNIQFKEYDSFQIYFLLTEKYRF